MLGRDIQRRGFNKLSPRKVATIATPGRHSDGAGLYLVVDPNGARRWVFLFRWKRPGEPGHGRLREMGLGSFLSVPLARAREKAAEARAKLADGIDPIAAKKALAAKLTFGEVADQVIALRAVDLRSQRSVWLWRRSLEFYAVDLRPLRIDTVRTEDVVAVLKPIWLEKQATALKVRGQIEAVLDAATARGLRSGDNPARWRGHLENLLPRPNALATEHRAALPFREIPAFVSRLREVDDVGARCLEFVILTAARSGEALGAAWSEIDLGAALWTVPASRMKSGKEHRVPLSAPALAIVTRASETRAGDHIFPGRVAGRPLSGTTLMAVSRRLGVDATVHGFRSAFRDWAGETTEFPREVAEAALAHSIGNEVERAYRRADALEKRRKLMEAWAAFCATGKA